MNEMRTIKQKDGIEVNSFDCKPAVDVHKHSALLPNSIRGILTGPSASGKTCLMISLLIDKNGLKFNNVYVYSKSLYQSKYQFLKAVLEKAPQIRYFPFKDSDEIIDPADVNENSIFIFDDVVCDKQNKIREYFSMGRHRSVDSFYLCQTYARIPKHLIRDNANFLVLFKQDDINLRHIYDEHVGADMPFDQFKSICSECWREKCGFLVVDKESDLHKGRYRKGLDSYIVQF